MDLFISAGFLLIRSSSRPAWTSGSILPEKIISACDCLCPLFPGCYAIEWTGDSKEEREKRFNAVGLSSALWAEATRWATDSFEEAFGWPGVFYSLEEAKGAKERFFSNQSEIQIIGLGLAEEFVDAFISDSTPEPPQPGYAPQGETGFLQVLKKHQALPLHGESLGFEPLCSELGLLSHSWLCNHLEVYFAEVHQIKVNEHGLIADFETAKRCCKIIEQDEIQAEPGLWLPWCLVRYE